MMCCSQLSDMFACDLQYLVLKGQVKRRRDDQASTREIRNLHMQFPRQLVDSVTCKMRREIIILDDSTMKEATLKPLKLGLHFLIVGDIPLQIHLPENL